MCQLAEKPHFTSCNVKSSSIQGVDEDDDIILMYRYFYHLDLHHDSMNVEILFKQAR